MNLFEKMAAVMRDVQYLAKDDHVEFKTTKYKAISEEKVTGTMRKAGRVKAVGKQKDPLTGVSVAVYEVVERCWKTVT